MGPIRTYFRQHRWQRRMLTLMTLAVLAGAVGLIVRPLLVDKQLLDQLSSQDPEVRQLAASRLLQRGADSRRLRRWIGDQLQAESDHACRLSIEILSKLARQHPDAVELLAKGLDSDIDERFALSARALQEHGLLASKATDAQFERWLYLRFPDPKQGPTLSVQRAILREAIFLDSRGPLLVSLAEKAGAAESPQVRCYAAALAARVGAIETLSNLLDDEPPVASAAALAAGFAGLHELADPLLKSLADAEDVDIASSAALALANLDAPAHQEAIFDRLARTDDGSELAERLVWVCSLLAGEQARDVIADRLQQATLPGPMEMLAAGQLGLVQAGEPIVRVLDRSTDPQAQVTDRQLIAALTAARALDLDAAEETERIVRVLWQPRLNLAMILAAENLGSALRTGRLSQEMAARIIDTLDQARRFAPAGDPQAAAVASAVAAAELWLLNPTSSWYTLGEGGGNVLAQVTFDPTSSAWWIHNNAGADNSLAGELIAWKLALSGRPEATRLAETMLDGPVPVRNEQRLGAAATMLALCGRLGMTDRTKAAELIRSKLHTRFGVVEDRYLQMSYRAALAVLGEPESIPTLRLTFEHGRGPLIRMAAGLLAAGDKSVMDWMFFSGVLTDGDLVAFYVEALGGRVVERFTGPMPFPQPAASRQSQLWQVRVLRHFWAQRHRQVQLRWPA
ncbi:MAG: hypothetical protein ACLFUJ_06780 [Phycisphaerae bacterium]